MEVILDPTLRRKDYFCLTDYEKDIFSYGYIWSLYHTPGASIIKIQFVSLRLRWLHLSIKNTL